MVSASQKALDHRRGGTQVKNFQNVLRYPQAAAEARTGAWRASSMCGIPSPGEDGPIVPVSFDADANQ